VLVGGSEIVKALLRRHMVISGYPPVLFLVRHVCGHEAKDRGAGGGVRLHRDERLRPAEHQGGGRNLQYESSGCYACKPDPPPRQAYARLVGHPIRRLWDWSPVTNVCGQPNVWQIRSNVARRSSSASSLTTVRLTSCLMIRRSTGRRGLSRRGTSARTARTGPVGTTALATRNRAAGSSATSARRSVRMGPALTSGRVRQSKSSSSAVRAD
jgi:hypothetical protein